MNQVKCPHCGKAFTIDESSYLDIVKQIKDKEFHSELHERLEQFKQAQAKDVILAQNEIEKKYSAKLTEKEQELLMLKEKMASIDNEKKMAVLTAETSLKEKLASQERLVVDLQNKLESTLKDKALEAQALLAKKTQELQALENKLLLEQKQAELEKSSIKASFDEKLKQKDDVIAFYKDFKAKQSTKMIGESLEVHCETEFNKHRSLGFTKATFGKDNDAQSGSKGDYIYREFDDNGIEIISIMFEMKNEADETATKKKNEHFLKELDKDRTEKKCEYAILVSLLESDSEYYNTGIVDVSHVYPKMYVIRP